MAAAVLLLAAAGCLTVGLRGHYGALADAPPQAVSPPGSLLAGASGGTAGPAAGAPLPSPGVAPASLQIPAIGVAASLGELGVNADQTVQVPADFAQPGWYGLGPIPGQLGSAVILGHVDSYRGPAVFFRLRSLQPGDEVEVSLVDGTVVHFRVTVVATYPKDRFPAQLVYAPHGGSVLNLVTCGGDFDTDTRSYLSNVVVTSTITAVTAGR